MNACPAGRMAGWLGLPVNVGAREGDCSARWVRRKAHRLWLGQQNGRADDPQPEPEWSEDQIRVILARFGLAL